MAKMEHLSPCILTVSFCPSLQMADLARAGMTGRTAATMCGNGFRVGPRDYLLHLQPNFASITLFIRVQQTNRDLIKPVRLFHHRPSPANGAKMALLPLADPSATLFRAALRQRVVECIERHASGPKSRSIPDAAVFERHVSCATP